MDTDQLILKEFVTHHRIDAARIIEQLKTEHSLALFAKIPVESVRRMLRPVGYWDD